MAEPRHATRCDVILFPPDMRTKKNLKSQKVDEGLPLIKIKTLRPPSNSRRIYFQIEISIRSLNLENIKEPFMCI